MLTKEIRQQIEDFVHQSPRTVQEIAVAIDKNWRTADRYVQQINEEFGTIATKTFREGSRGALKLVYWNALVGQKGTSFQERLKTLILAGKTKYDFSPMSIYQFADVQKREAYTSKKSISDDFEKMLASAQRQVLFFSGNLSWLQEEKHLIKEIEKLAKRGIKLKFLTRVDLTSQSLVSKILSLNTVYGEDLVSIRHCEQPLRGMIIDETIVSLKEVYSPTRQREVTEHTSVYYKITDITWTTWIQKIFWHLWEQSIDAQSRIDALNTISKK